MKESVGIIPAWLRGSAAAQLLSYLLLTLVAGWVVFPFLWGVLGGHKNRLQSKFQDNVIDYRRVVRALHEAGYTGYICVEYVWTEWEGCNEVDNLSETIQMRDLLRSVDLT